MTDHLFVQARAALLARPAPLRLVIFDCDGVLIDSEAVASRVVAASLTEVGWPLTPEESQAIFLGLSLRQMVPMIETRMGRRLPADWTDGLRARMLAALAEEAKTMPGAEAMLVATSALGLPWRVASNSSHEEMGVKFRRTGLHRLMDGRLHSHRDVARGKPAPDLFLAAAAAERVPPECCVVVEDSLPGIEGGLAAGMTVLGYAPDGGGAALRAAGAWPVTDLSHVPLLLRDALRRAA